MIPSGFIFNDNFYWRISDGTGPYVYDGQVMILASASRTDFFKGYPATQAAMLGIVASIGDWCVRSDLNQRFDLVGVPSSLLGNWVGVPGGGGGGGGGGGPATWGTITGTLASQIDLQGALDGRALSGHSHSVFGVGAPGFVPASGVSNTTDFLRRDGTFAVPAGSGTSLVVQEGDATVVTVATTLDFNANDFNVTETPTGEANVEASANMARVITPFAETGVAFNITNAAHARDGTATNAAAITATFDFTGMAAQTAGQIQQGGAGIVTLAATAVGGAAITYSYAPGAGSSPTTVSQGGFICWRYLGGTSVLIEFRSQIPAAGGGSRTDVPMTLTAAAIGNSQSLAVLATGTIPANAWNATARKLVLEHYCEFVNTATAELELRVRIGGAGGQIFVFDSAGNSFGGTSGVSGIYNMWHLTAANTQRARQNVNGLGSNFNFGQGGQILGTQVTTGALTIELLATTGADATVSISCRGCKVSIE